MKSIRGLFTHELKSHLPGYRFREEQLSLAENIEAVIADGSVGVFEAGTGTGKTLAYLVPAFLESGTVVISTATKNLQDQLLYKDVPAISQLITGRRVSVLKGRANYLCPYRLELHVKSMKRDQPSEALMSRLTEVRAWASRSSTGDLGELLDPEEDSQLINLVTSTRDNCLAGRCPKINECPLYHARERARQADIVIVNHHLLFADIAQKEESLQALLPEADAVIVDEAHQVADIARNFYGESVSSRQFVELIKDTRTELGRLGNDEPTVTRAADLLEKAAEKLRGLILESEENQFQVWLNASRKEAVHQIDLGLETLTEHLNRIADRSEGLAQLAKRGAGMLDRFTLLTEADQDDSDYVHWIDRRERGYVIHLSPISVAGQIAAITAGKTAWVFLSATIGVDGRFDHFAGELGLTTDIQATYPSPFDYGSSVKALIPAGLPEPADPEHTAQLVKKVLPVIRSQQGRTFFLFTSHRALNEAAALMKNFERPVLVQGTMSRSRMMENFAALEGCVLLATQSFWEGVDARGMGLKCLIIDKLPFPSPGEPVFAALCRQIDREGGRSFDELSLPKTALALKQGFGRLIRSETDTGLFVLGDIRMLKRGYRHYLKNNLPEIPWTDDVAEAISWLLEQSRAESKIESDLASI